MTTYQHVSVMDDGSWTGQALTTLGDPINFQADPTLFIIREAWHKGLDLEAEADGFGEGEGTHGDWSAIRDSSNKAIDAMLTKTLNFLFSK